MRRGTGRFLQRAAARAAGCSRSEAPDTRTTGERIDVDTAAGKVVLRGTASGVEARATQLAQGVKGVTAVDNQLEAKS